jgi:lipopolysaccharide transport system ATP-binding protein
MYVRLAFAVAAHLEPEIRIVDEVLAVGDAEFQKKCLGKMNEVSRMEGRTVLFVTHNMGIITSLCPTVIWIEKGSAREHGWSPENVLISLGCLHLRLMVETRSALSGLKHQALEDSRPTDSWTNISGIPVKGSSRQPSLASPRAQVRLDRR